MQQACARCIKSQPRLCCGCAVLRCAVLQLLDRHLAASECGGAQALGSLDSQLAETEDVLSYVSDLLSLGAHTTPCRCPLAAAVAGRV